MLIGVLKIVKNCRRVKSLSLKIQNVGIILPALKNAISLRH